MTDIDQALNEFSDKLQEEANEKVDFSMKIFDSLAPESQSKVIQRLQMHKNYSRNELIEVFDTMELIDELEHIDRYMQSLTVHH